jgi:hypothetical protein
MRHHRFTNSQGTAHVAGSKSGGRYKSKLERNGFIRWLMNPEVEQVTLQQPRIQYFDQDGEPHRYTGDLLVEFYAATNRRALVIECKYTSQLKSHPELQIKHDAVGAAMNALGRDFIVQTEEDIYAPGFAMMKFVFEHRNNAAHPAQREILAYVKQHGSVNVGELIAALRAHRIAQLELIPEVWRLVAHHSIRVDFKKTLDLSAKLWPGSVLREISPAAAELHGHLGNPVERPACQCA